ncbi:SDR family NAD(P)-dependent oxidoreductase [Streptomyces sp. NBC_00035]|uniref:SDR family NAD(P)-dependent oxidoreductase n=1 Tax=Streptomyces sp. NBC_00035 TaxID=2903614 RepID=UPI0032548B36
MISPGVAGRLAGRTAFITGAGGALGAAIAEAFAREGARALTLSDIRVEAVGDLAARLRRGGVEVTTPELDVTDGDAFDRAVRSAVEAFDGLDLLVNNAGAVSPNARIHNVTTDDFDRCVRINLTGTFHGVRAAARVMRDRGGSVINIASVAGLTAWPYAAPYGVAKAGIIHLTRVAALEYAKERIRINCVCPGAFPSAIHDGVPDGAMDVIEARHPFGLGKPQDLTGAVTYLASDEAAWTTGQAIVVDGGYSLP